MGVRDGGPLAGVRVLELGGIGPTQFAGMFLSELGADVVRVDRQQRPESFWIDYRQDQLNRGKRSIVLDLKSPEAVEQVRAAVPQLDVVLEGFRPGVAERLGLGPEDLLARNPKLVYGRMTGWGQNGPLAWSAGHDINYISLTGLLDAIGEADRSPVPPLSVVGDFGGGGAYLVIGVLAALRAVATTGQGQVVDASILDGTAHLLTAIHSLVNDGSWVDRRQHNVIDGGAPFYGVYRTADDRHLAVGAVETEFYGNLLRVLGLDELLPHQFNRDRWPADRARIAEVIAQRSQAEWLAAFEGVDACVTPVVPLTEAARHPHVAARGTLVEQDGKLVAAPAPRFSGTPTRPVSPPPLPGAHTEEVLAEWRTR